MMHITDNEGALLDYLYEEGDPAERMEVARHLQACAQCSVALLELQSVRGMLGEWVPPAVAPGFTVVADVPAPVPARALRPMWAQAVGAIMVFALGMAASQVRFEYAGGVLTVRSRTAAQVAAADRPIVHTGTDVLLPPTVVSTPGASSLSADRAGASTNPALPEEMLRRVQALIDQSESRQRRELALRLSDVVHDFDAQRQADMQRVDQNFGQLEGQTGTEVARQRELLNSLVKVSQGGSR